MENITLYNGVKIPIIGFGVWKLYENTKTAVKCALNNGYTHIDTAMIYKNENSVGDAIKESNVKREDIFVTTKLWNDDIRSGNVRSALNDSLERLQLDYIDLYLLHWPADNFCNAWLEVEKLYNEQKIRAIGVSNFQKRHLEELCKIANIKPMVNQIESHPFLLNDELIDYCKNDNIAVEAWGPLGGTDKGSGLLTNDILLKLSEKYNKSVAQIILRWNVQRNVIVLPKSKTESRIIENINVFDFNIDDSDIKIINELNKNTRFGPDPDNFDF